MVWAAQCLQTVRQNEAVGAARRGVARMTRRRILVHTMVATCMLVSTARCGGHLGLDSDVYGQLHENAALLCEPRATTQTARIPAIFAPIIVTRGNSVRIRREAAARSRGADVDVHFGKDDTSTGCPYGSRKPENKDGSALVSSNVSMGIGSGTYGGDLAGGNRLPNCSAMALCARFSRLL